jgi:hypothetical protein
MRQAGEPSKISSLITSKSPNLSTFSSIELN